MFKKLLDFFTGDSEDKALTQTRSFPETKICFCKNINSSECKMEQKVNKSKLGGTPNWIQADETPVCCGHKMGFLCQIESPKNITLADRGIVYVFICLECWETKSILQSH